MPLYEYKCSDCGTVFEVMQRFSDDPLKTHEGCGGAVERLLSAPALQFKGSGWYITDYANGKSGNGKNSNGKNGSSDSSSSTPKTESKPASSGSSTTKDKS